MREGVDDVGELTHEIDLDNALCLPVSDSQEAFTWENEVGAIQTWAVIVPAQASLDEDRPLLLCTVMNF